MLKIQAADLDLSYLTEITDSLKNNEVILIPTETVYGLSCAWKNQKAEELIYEMKNRPANKKMQVLISDFEQLSLFQINVSQTAQKIMKIFWPGPLTIIFEQSNGETVGLRMPDSEIVLKIIRSAGFPLTATSANSSGKKNVNTVEESIEQLAFPPSIVIDAGRLENPIASTVIWIKGNDFEVIREGSLSQSEIQKVIT